MVDKVFEILDYFKPKYWWIENPQTGKMKYYIEKIRPDIKWYDVDYCKYGFPYKKRTRFWTNISSFNPKVCKKDCEFMVPIGETSYHLKNNGKTKSRRKVSNHMKTLGNGYIIVNGERILCNTKKLREKYQEEIEKTKELIKIHKSDVSRVGGSTNKLERYRIPEKLIEELFDCIY
jgi:hypothetical protein